MCSTLPLLVILGNIRNFYCGCSVPGYFLLRANLYESYQYAYKAVSLAGQCLPTAFTLRKAHIAHCLCKIPQTSFMAQPYQLLIFILKFLPFTTPFISCLSPIVHVLFVSPLTLSINLDALVGRQPEGASLFKIWIQLSQNS
jgi:hypothetical protein